MKVIKAKKFKESECLDFAFENFFANAKLEIRAKLTSNYRIKNDYLTF